MFHDALERIGFFLAGDRPPVAIRIAPPEARRRRQKCTLSLGRSTQRSWERGAGKITRATQRKNRGQKAGRSSGITSRVRLKFKIDRACRRSPPVDISSKLLTLLQHVAHRKVAEITCTRADRADPLHVGRRRRTNDIEAGPSTSSCYARSSGGSRINGGQAGQGLLDHLRRIPARHGASEGSCRARGVAFCLIHSI